ncbi:hypothetical protein HC766_08330 [Candidatus Gracilibacteria bacterium]|nr:hypothetical protein [Candidatus Gracilibacteria bacterium]
MTLLRQSTVRSFFESLLRFPSYSLTGFRPEHIAIGLDRQTGASERNVSGSEVYLESFYT